MIDHRRIAYARLDVEFDRESLAEEYDRCILPESRRIAGLSRRGLESHASLNRAWGMVPPDVYARADVTIDSRDGASAIQQNGYPCWLAHSLVVCNSDNERWARESKYGSVAIRNRLGLTHTFDFAPEFADLQITRLIRSLPLTNIIGARCVSLDPGTFAPIHRDNSGDSLRRNHLVDAGFVNLSLNISDGGVPLVYAMPDAEAVPLEANAPLFMLSDFYLHGVPLTTGRRRQIRITGRPTAAFEALIDKATLSYEKTRTPKHAPRIRFPSVEAPVTP
jgi:hypothetical protein